MDAVGTSPLVVGEDLPSITPPESVSEIQLFIGSEISATISFNPDPGQNRRADKGSGGSQGRVEGARFIGCV